MSDDRIKLGVCANQLDDDPRHAVIPANRMGADGVILAVDWPQLDLTALSQSGRRELRALLSRQRLELIALDIRLPVKALHPEGDADAAIAYMRRMLESAAALQCPMVCAQVGRVPAAVSGARGAAQSAEAAHDAGAIVIPTKADIGLMGIDLPGASEESKRPVSVDPAFMSHCDAMLASIGEFADRTGVRLALGSDLASPKALASALSRVDCPSLGIDLDPTAMLREGIDIDTLLNQATAHLMHVRARDGHAGEQGRVQPQPVGAGEISYPELLKALDAAGYGGWLTIDAQGLPDLRAGVMQGMQTLRPMLQ